MSVRRTIQNVVTYVSPSGFTRTVQYNIFESITAPDRKCDEVIKLSKTICGDTRICLMDGIIHTIIRRITKSIYKITISPGEHEPIYGNRKTLLTYLQKQSLDHARIVVFKNFAKL